MLSSLDHANFSPRGSGTSLRVFASLGHFVRFQFLSTLMAARTSEVMRLEIAIRFQYTRLVLPRHSGVVLRVELSCTEHVH